jgi:hypothetical protein
MADVLCPPPHLSDDEAVAKMGHPAAFARCPWLKPQFNQAAFRGLKAPAPSANRQRQAPRICGRKGSSVGVGASSSGFLRLRLAQRARQTPLRITSEKQATAGPSTSFGAKCAPNSAQDDSENRQRRNAGVLRLRLAQRARQTPLRMTSAKQATAGPSTSFGAKSTPNSAQDDSFVG